MPNLVEIVVKTIDESGAGMASAERKAKESGARAGKGFSEGLKPSIAGIGKALVGAFAITEGIDLFKGYIERAEQAEKVTGLVSAAIKSTGGAANVTTTEVEELARSISLKTGKDELAIRSGDAMLLTFRNIRNVAGQNNDIFNQATGVLTDMTAAMHGGDVTADGMRKQAIQLGKALNDPIQGLSALRRVGVTFTQQQKNQITTMEESGNILGAQKVILKELVTEFGNAAAKSSTPTERFTNDLKLLEDNSKAVVDPLVRATAATLGFFEAESEKASKQGSFGRQILDFFKQLTDTRNPAAAHAAYEAAARGQKDLTQKLKEGESASSRWAQKSIAAKIAAQQQTIATTTLTTALKGLTDGLLTSEQDEVSWKQAQHAATAAINANTGSLDSNKGSALAARSAIISSTNAALGFANQETNLHHNTDKASDIIRAQIRYLQDHAGKSKIAKEEIAALREALKKLQDVGPIHENIFMTGKGKWTATGSALSQAGQFAGGSFLANQTKHGAKGLLVPGRDSGRDDQLVMARGGELMVPPEIVSSGAVDHLKGSIPGFAGGGIVPSYRGGVGKNFRNWTTHNWNATGASLINSMGNAMARQFANAMSSMMSFPGGGALGGSAAANMAIARRMFPWPGWMWPSFNYLEMREAGYSLTARNPSSGAYGVAQFINGPGEYFQYGGNPYSAGGQFTGMFNYIRQRYGNPVGAAAHERAFNWYGNGLEGVFRRPTLIGVGERGAEHVSVTPAGRGGGQTVRVVIDVRGGSGNFEQAMVDWIRDCVQVYGGGDIQEAFGA